MWVVWVASAVGTFLLLVVVHDLIQRKHAILKNFPVIGHFRYLLEAIGPELRQYIVTSNDEELPFNRDQRRWVYASSKKQDNYFGFGTDSDLEQSSNYLIIKHSAFPIPSPTPDDADYDPYYTVPVAKVMGGYRNRRRAFRPPSIVNVSAMSFGSLSGNAIHALNAGSCLSGCLHNTGEGGISPHHLQGGDLIWQIGTGYFGCRDEQGRFDLDRLVETTQEHSSVRAIELKLSQGAKPGLGGILPSSKITPEIAAIRGIPMGRDCISPSAHTAFSDADSLLDFVEQIAEATGLPVGIKSAVGEMDLWHDLARLTDTTDRGLDFITIDGGEGGTGAGPLVFTDRVALPFKIGMSRVYRVFAERGLHEKVLFQGSAKLGFPEMTLFAFALGCDMIGVAREAMLAIGCIQAQRCHNGHCPTGVATQNRWLVRGLDPLLKSDRLANYVMTLRKEVLALSRACGVVHPALITSEHLEILDSRFGSATVPQLFGYEPSYGLPSPNDCTTITELMNSGTTGT
ncbi:MAG: FMN-binding glutamate synthase family protein [Planctomycetota bacterium]|nr:FMN-binding glutamate synthase family protein [Planctomycetota bacterium]